jgi:hypothetical protein
MNAPHLALQSSDDAQEDDQELKSEVRAASDRSRERSLDVDPPAWDSERPQPLLPHDPRAFDRPSPYPDHEEVLRGVAAEALGNGLTRRMF